MVQKVLLREVKSNHALARMSVHVLHTHTIARLASNARMHCYQLPNNQKRLKKLQASHALGHYPYSVSNHPTSSFLVSQSCLRKPITHARRRNICEAIANRVTYPLAVLNFKITRNLLEKDSQVDRRGPTFVSLLKFTIRRLLHEKINNWLN